MTIKGFSSSHAENRELFDTSSYGRFSIPDTVMEFVVELAKPEPGERLLAVGLCPESLVAFVDNAVDIQVVTAGALPVRHGTTDAPLYDVILCAPYSGNASSATNEPNKEMWLKWSVEHLKKDGRLAIIVPISLPTNYSQESNRNFVADNLYFRVNFSKVS